MRFSEHAMTRGPKDTLYANSTDAVPPFTFNEAVSEVFGDMIRRSVPGYDTVVRATGVFVAEAYKGQGVVYDLGCSLGEAARFVLAACGDNPPSMVLVDASESMIARCEERFLGCPNVRCMASDVITLDFETAAAFVLNFTLQFIAIAQRIRLLRRIHESLLPGGVLIVSEKIRLEPSAKDNEAIRRHHAFKRLMGYSDHEILGKRDALEDVLVPDTLDGLTARLREAGFADIQVWFACLNWVSLVVRKNA